MRRTNDLARNHPPHRARAGLCHARALALALPLLLASAAATAQVVNVATLVTGTAERTPSSSLRTPCGSACTWATASGAAVSDNFQVEVGALTLASWPPLWLASLQAPQEVADSQTVPPPSSGAMWTGLAEGPRHLAEVAYSSLMLAPAGQRQLGTENFRVGNGAAVLSYAVRIHNATAQPQAQWLEFSVPTAAPVFATATNPLGGPSGYQAETAYPDLQATRTTVDVVVDGLPVWSSTQNRLRPKRVPGVKGDLWLKTGSALGNGKTTLFLCTLPAKSALHVLVVLRTDARLLAPDCKLDYSVSPSLKRCHAHREQLGIPSVAAWSGAPTLRPAIDVFLN